MADLEPHLAIMLMPIPKVARASSVAFDLGGQTEQTGWQVCSATFDIWAELERANNEREPSGTVLERAQPETHPNKC